MATKSENEILIRVDERQKKMYQDFKDFKKENKEAHKTLIDQGVVRNGRLSALENTIARMKGGIAVVIAVLTILGMALKGFGVF